MPTISRDVWITKEGVQIEIERMASAHLLATIHLIERSRFTRAHDYAFNSNFEVHADDTILAHYMEWPLQYDTLIAEAQRRGLLNRGVEGIEKSKRRK